MTSIPTDRFRVGNVGFTVMPLTDAMDLVLALGDDIANVGHPGIAVHFCNAYNVALARKDLDYARVLKAGDIVFSDGVPITWVGRKAYPEHAAAWERVYGPDVMRGVFGQSTQAKHYLLGGSPETLASLEARLRADYPSAQIVGVESPPFRSASDAELAERDERIRHSRATIVWVGLGTPKQDVEVQRLARSVPAVAMAVGAAFDFLGGTKRQAPVWMQRSGTEWAFRLASEPRRLGTRYVWGNSVFLAEAARTLVPYRKVT